MFILSIDFDKSCPCDSMQRLTERAWTEILGPTGLEVSSLKSSVFIDAEREKGRKEGRNQGEECSPERSEDV